MKAVFGLSCLINIVNLFACLKAKMKYFSNFYVKYAALNLRKIRIKSHRFLNGRVFLKAD